MWPLLIPFAAPLSPAWLAPGPRELSEATAEMEALVARMDAVGTALGRVQSAWGEALAAGKTPDPCSDPEAASLVARARIFGASYRDTVQSGRAQFDRMEDLWAAPTVVPLLDDDDRAHAEELRIAVDHHVRAWLEAASWHDDHIEGTMGRCPATLIVSAGFEYLGAPSTRHDPLAAIIGMGGGVVCPAGVPADGRVVVTTGAACLQAATPCTCEPQPVLPGAVVGP